MSSSPFEVAYLPRVYASYRTPTMADIDVRGSISAPHLVVLVHGLWGNPSHMQTIAEQLRARHPPDSLRILIAATNTGYTTYDGIEVGGERVAAEIEKEIAAVSAAGGRITRFSILGYSLGGLISRYCIGLLYARGLFEAGKPDSIEPVTFTTFASPWLGVRAPLKWFGTHAWNFLGARTLSTSGQQMFTTDNFRGTGRPLLSIMADPSSIFFQALASFKNKVIYCNIVNDRSTPFWTTSISALDPFRDPSLVDFGYVEGYAPTILDVRKPIMRKQITEKPTLYSKVVDTGYRWLTRLPLVTLLVAMLPLTATVYFCNAGFQTFRSTGRRKAHESGRAGSFSSYRVPFLLEQALESADGRAAPQYLDEEDGDSAIDENGSLDPKKAVQTAHPGPGNALVAKKRYGIETDAPTVALSPEQFEMIANLNSLDIHKYPVHITLISHSHAAIVVRWKKDTFKEGYTVISHWIDEKFEL